MLARPPFLDSGGSGALLDAYFSANQYKQGGSTFGTPNSLVGWSFSRPSPKTALNSSGAIVSFASGVPAITDLGFLIEESRTNLALWSQDFSNAVWTKAAATATAAAGTAPDGTTTASKLVESATNAGHYTYQSFTITANSVYAASVFVKANGRTKGRLWWTNSTSTNAVYADYDLSAVTVSTGVVGSGVLTTASITAVASGWYRVTVVGKIDATTTTGFIELDLHDNLGNATYTGDGVSGAFLWGAQPELGAFPTSYIPTTSSAVTRAADVATITLGSALAVPSSVLLNYSIAQTQPSGVVRLFTVTNAGDTHRIGGFIPSISSQFRFGNEAAATNTANSAALGAVAKAGATYGASAIDGVLNGGAVATVSATMASDLTLFNIGHEGGSNQFDGYLQRIVIYQSALSDAQLQALTQ